MEANGLIIIEESGETIAQGTGRLVIGARSGCDLVLRDPVIADRHCAVVFDGTFRIRDLDSVTGTYVDGAPAEEKARLEEGNEIVLGLTRLTCRFREGQDVPTLVLELERNAFHFARSRKGAFDNDPDRWVRTEVDLGRFPRLRMVNRLAIVAALVLTIAGTFVTSVVEPLVDAGPLAPGHAALIAGDAVDPAIRLGILDFEKESRHAQTQRCGVCHRHGTTPVNQCMKCHNDLETKGTWRHPYLRDGKLGDPGKLTVDEGFCARCHTDHVGTGTTKPYSDTVLGKCEKCHIKKSEELKQLDLPNVELRGRTVPPFKFPHNAHVDKGINCGACHKPGPIAVGLAAKGLDNPNLDDFTQVPYETCAKCHVPDPARAAFPSGLREEWLPKPDNQWTVTWHGSEGGADTCGRCHDGTTPEDGFGPELRQVERLSLDATAQARDKGTYELVRRSHDPEFETHSEGRDCKECHPGGASILAGKESVGGFWHALHLPETAMAPRGKDSQEAVTGTCLLCHGDQKESKGLLAAGNGDWWRAQVDDQKACVECHNEGSKPGKPIGLRPVPKTDWPKTAFTKISDFPHRDHLKVSGGCFACHEFKKSQGDDPLRMVPRTPARARDCKTCHGKHENIAGGNCRKCHQSMDGEDDSYNVYIAAAKFTKAESTKRGLPSPKKRGDWPERNTFSHFSKGHKEETCNECHDAGRMKEATTIMTVPLPHEGEQRCRECHLKKRFHWR
jgi:FHA domain/Outer membrane cytochrome MtrC/MtrF-like, domains II/IV